MEIRQILDLYKESRAMHNFPEDEWRKYHDVMAITVSCDIIHKRIFYNSGYCTTNIPKKLEKTQSESDLETELETEILRGAVLTPHYDFEDISLPIIAATYQVHNDGTTIEIKALYTEKGLPFSPSLLTQKHLDEIQVIFGENFKMFVDY